MVMPVTYRDSDYPLARGRSSFQPRDERRDTEGRLEQVHRHGVVCAPEGVVVVDGFCDVADGGDGFTTAYLRMVVAGRKYNRTVMGCGITELALARQARRFARDVASRMEAR